MFQRGSRVSRGSRSPSRRGSRGSRRRRALFGGKARLFNTARSRSRIQSERDASYMWLQCYPRSLHFVARQSVVGFFPAKALWLSLAVLLHTVLYNIGLPSISIVSHARHPIYTRHPLCVPNAFCTIIL